MLLMYICCICIVSLVEECCPENDRSVEHEISVNELCQDETPPKKQAAKSRSSRQGEREAWNLEDVEVEIMESNSPEEKEADMSLTTSTNTQSGDCTSTVYSLIDADEKALLDLLGKGNNSFCISQFGNVIQYFKRFLFLVLAFLRRVC